MARKFLTAIDLAKNELQNAAVQNLGSAPSSPVKGQLYMNTSDNTLYWWDGAQWVAAKGAAGATPAGTVTTSAVADASVVGVSTNFAREDHKHGREAFGAVTAETAFGAASGNGSAVTLPRSDHVHGTPTHDNAAHSTIKLNALAVPDGPVSMNGQLLTSVGTPVSGNDATNKTYVDNLIAGLAWKDSVRVATTANHGGSGLTAIDGITPIAGDRILWKNSAAPETCGIYIAAAGTWARATDVDSAAELNGAAVFVERGTVNAGTAWVMTSLVTTLGSDAVIWTQFAGGGAVVAGAGMTQSGNTLNVIGDATITVGADSIGQAAMTGDVTTVAGANAATIANDAVTNAKLANMPATTVKANSGGGAADPQDLTLAQFAAMFAGTFARVFTAATHAAATTVDVVHNFATRNVQAQVFRTATPYDTIECDVERYDPNGVRFRFAVAPAANEYTFVIVG